VAITIFAKLEAFLLSSKSNRAVVPSIFGFPRDLLGHSRALLAKAPISCEQNMIRLPIASVKEAALKLGFITEAEFDRVVDPTKMTRPYVAKAS
jgi:hypothetical protein